MTTQWALLNFTAVGCGRFANRLPTHERVQASGSKKKQQIATSSDVELLLYGQRILIRVACCMAFRNAF
jgi:hypothetical protein